MPGCHTTCGVPMPVFLFSYVGVARDIGIEARID